MATGQPILSELLDPLGDCLTPEVAERIARLRASDSAGSDRGSAARNAEGRLSKLERDEFDAHVSAGHVIAILQAKARRLLRDSSP